MLNEMFWYSWDSKHSNIVEDNKNYIWLPTQGNSLTQAYKYSCKTKGYPQNVIRSNLRCQLMTAMNKNERGFLSSVAFNLVEEESQFRLSGKYCSSTSLWLQECWNIYTLYQFVSFQQFQIRVSRQPSTGQPSTRTTIRFHLTIIRSNHKISSFTGQS